MKSKAVIFFKQMAIAVAAAVKSKSMALKNKAIAMKTKLIIFRLLRDKKVLLSAMSKNIHSVTGQDECGGTSYRAILMLNAGKDEVYLSQEEEDDDDDEYLDLRHTLFDLQDEQEEEEGMADGSTGSVIDWIRNCREDGSECNLEDEIDHVADAFIGRFHRQMRLEKQESINRYQEMLENVCSVDERDTAMQ